MNFRYLGTGEYSDLKELVTFAFDLGVWSAL